MQSAANTCGFAALANAFKAIGRPVTEDRLTQLARKVAPSDTPEQDGAGVRVLQAVAASLGYALIPYKFADVMTAWALVRHCLGEAKPVLLAVDDSSHWVTLVGLLGDGVLLCDPADPELVVPQNLSSLSPRWGADFYALVLLKAQKQRRKTK